ncbi:MAG: molecular chaperone TorD family protein [Dehalococcoidia bacterium]|nr:MAG: molecular chaperone TorD family protein [Dehalococcoidia bacterium]
MMQSLESRSKLSNSEFRRDAYQLLSECYYLPDAGFANKVNDLDALSEGMYASVVKNCLKKENLDSLIIDYTKLFIGPYGLLAPPYGSIYLEENDRVMGNSTMDARRSYIEEGLDICLKDAPDHIAIELEFMYFLVFKEIEAAKSDDYDSILSYREKQRVFLKNHLGAWASDFTSKIKASAQTEFYKNLARITKNFIDNEKRNLGALI